jgi:hypothetical protein
MSDTATTRSVVQILVDVMRTVRAVGKDGRNEQQHFNFRGVDAVMNAVGPALRDAGIVVIPRVVHSEYGTVTVGRNGTSMGHVRVEVEYTFYGPAGDTLVGSAVGEAMDSGDKATAKAMSVAFRTYLIQSLCLPTCDIDPDEETYERSPQEHSQDTGNGRSAGQDTGCAMPAGPSEALVRFLADAAKAATAQAIKGMRASLTDEQLAADASPGINKRARAVTDAAGLTTAGQSVTVGHWLDACEDFLDREGGLTVFSALAAERDAQSRRETGRAAA